MQTNLSGWGNYPQSPAIVHSPQTICDLESLNYPLPRGLGRSYGDAALSSGKHIAMMEDINKILDFDSNTGLLKAEAGCSLAKLIELYTPQGWFPSVTPGTKFVTLGGCLAADVHGKNHHLDGCFSNFIKNFTIFLADGTRKCCSIDANPDLFWATVGGMGLTGIVTDVTIKLQRIESAYMKVTHYDAPDLSKALEILSDRTIDEKYSVAWIDCLAKPPHLGRSVAMVGRHASKTEAQSDAFKIKEKRQISIPFNMPPGTLNSFVISCFNSIFYRFKKNKETYITDYDSYFYPLDTLKQWNKLYGRRGFIQYQFVVPMETAEKALSEILNKISSSKRGSFLAVLKKFGPEGKSFLSFPKEGMTLALDFPINAPSLFTFLDELDDLVIKYNGRTYLAKDSRMKPEVFRQMYPRFDEWLAVKHKYDPVHRFQSDLSHRLKIHH